jgi:hypothetical protein
MLECSNCGRLFSNCFECGTLFHLGKPVLLGASPFPSGIVPERFTCSCHAGNDFPHYDGCPLCGAALKKHVRPQLALSDDQQRSISKLAVVTRS